MLKTFQKTHSFSNKVFIYNKSTISNKNICLGSVQTNSNEGDIKYEKNHSNIWYRNSFLDISFSNTPPLDGDSDNTAEAKIPPITDPDWPIGEPDFTWRDCGSFYRWAIEHYDAYDDITKVPGWVWKLLTLWGCQPYLIF